MNLKKVLCLGLMLTPTLGVQSVFAMEDENRLDLNNLRNNNNNENIDEKNNTTEMILKNKLNTENNDEEIDTKEPPEKYINMSEKFDFAEILQEYADGNIEKLDNKSSSYVHLWSTGSEKLTGVEFVAKTVLAEMVRRNSFEGAKIPIGTVSFSTIALPNRDFLKVLKDVGNRFKETERKNDYDLFLTYYGFGEIGNYAYLAGPCIVPNGHNCLAGLLHPVRSQVGVFCNNLETVEKNMKGLLKQKQSSSDELKKFEAILSKKVSDLEEIHKKQIEDIQKSFKEILNSQQQLIVKLQTEVKERDEIIARLSKEVDELKKSRIQQTVPQVTTRSIVTSNTNDIGTRKIVTHNSDQNDFSTVFNKTTINQNQHRKPLDNKSNNRGKSHSRPTNKTEMLSQFSQFGSRMNLSNMTNIRNQNTRITPQNAIKLNEQDKTKNLGLGSRIDSRSNNFRNNPPEINQNSFANPEFLKLQIENNQNNDIRSNQGNRDPLENTDAQVPPSNTPTPVNQTTQLPNGPQSENDYLELVRNKINETVVSSVIDKVGAGAKKLFKKNTPEEIVGAFKECFEDYQGTWTKTCINALIMKKCKLEKLGADSGFGKKVRDGLLEVLFQNQ